MDTDFVLGLIVGEGCFTISMRKADSYEHGVSFIPEVRVVMHERDRELLEKVQEETGFGRVSVKNKKSQTTVQWAITKREEVKEFRDWVEEHKTPLFEASKAGRTFERWAKYVEKCEPPIEKEQARQLVEVSKSMNDSGWGGRSAEDWKAIIDSA